jgi:solute carrier family 25 carnitine/acylcarnitine transporter 20/29
MPFSSEPKMSLTDEMELRFKEESRANARRLSATRNFIAGSMGGMFSCIVGQPLDMIKVRLQVMPNVQLGHTPPFTGPIDCLAKIIKTDGLRSLFRGMLAPILMATPGAAISFYSLSLGKRLQLDNPKQEPTPLQYMKAGFFAGFCCGFIFCPVERLKCLIQVQKVSTGIAKKKGPLDILREVYRKESLRGVFRGQCLTLVRDVGGSGAWYLTYESLLKAMRPRDGTRDDVSLMSIVLAGGTAGLVFWALMYPVDVLKTRYQVAPVGLYPRGGRDILKVVIQNEGLKALYRGYVPALVRAPVVHIALFVGYEFTLRVLNKLFP